MTAIEITLAVLVGLLLIGFSWLAYRVIDDSDYFDKRLHDLEGKNKK